MTSHLNAITEFRLDDDASIASLAVYDGTMLHHTHDCTRSPLDTGNS